MNRVFIICAVCGCAVIANAHEVRPAYLELRETGPETYDILWKVPARGMDERLGIYVRLPAGTEQLSEPLGMFAGGAYLDRWRVRRPGGLAGQTIAVDGLAATDTDVLARVERADGSTQTARLLPSHPSFVVEAGATLWGVASAYLLLGVEHILFGVDHLLFVLALLLLVERRKRLIGAITAFTVAHSVTLALAALGLVQVPGPPVEACIALSIVFVAAEITRTRPGRPSLTERAPWLVAFAFGLLHGLGFAGALSEIGLPRTEIPAALLMFNVGVELGQLMFVAVALAFLALARRFRMPQVPALRPLPAYAIGTVAAFWTIDRVASFPWGIVQP